MVKPPTVKMVDEACRLGFKVFYGNRPVMGAVAHRAAEIAINGRIWIHLSDDLTWHYVSRGDVVITNNQFGRRQKKVMPTGKRRDGSPSHLKLAKKGGAQQPPEKPEKVGASESDPPATPSGRRKGGGSVVVSRTKAKQGELPGVETSKRKIAEIEDLAEIYDDKKAAKQKATDEFKDAEENLVVSMKKHDRMSYSRSTWGKVKVKGSKESISFKRDKQNKKDE